MRYIVLFDDGTMAVYSHKQYLENMGGSAIAIYEVSAEATMRDLCDWIGNQYKHKLFILIESEFDK